MAKAKSPRIRIDDAAIRFAQAQYEAGWTNGYRAAAGGEEEERLYPKEREQWTFVEKEYLPFRRIVSRALTEASRGK